jgi:hypothetical protein
MPDAWNLIPQPLAARTKKLLNTLLLISYAPTSKPRIISQGKSEDKPPPKCDPIYEHYVARVSAAVLSGNEKKVAELCDDMEREIARYRGHDAAERVLPTDEAEAIETVLREYEGVDAKTVTRRLTGSRPGGVLRQRVTVGWVKQVRRLNRRDPDNGERLSGWRGWDEKRRVEEIRKRRELGHFQDRIAGELKVSPRTLSNYWANATP